MKKTKIETLLNAEFPVKGVTERDYLDLIESGELKGKIFMGIDENGFIIKDPLDDPGVFCYGGQGSGKSTSLKAICTTVLCASSETTFMPFIDVSDKGMGDYKQFWPYTGNTCRVLFEIQKIVPLMDLLARELAARGKAFRDIGGANNIKQYEEMYREKLARYRFILENLKSGKGLYGAKHDELLKFLLNKNSIGGPYKTVCSDLEEYKGDQKESAFNQVFKARMNLNMNDSQYLEYISSLNILRLTPEQNLAIAEAVKKSDITSEDVAKLEYTKEFVGVAQIYPVFEEFHNIPNSEQVNFDEKKDTFGSVAQQMFALARTGRSFGICFFVATQKASYKEFPSDIQVGITNIMAHKGPGNGCLELPQDSGKLLMSGHFIHKSGQGRSIYLTDSIMDKLLRKYVKPCKGEMFGPSIQEYHEALSGVGAEGMIKNYPLFNVVSNYSVFIKTGSSEARELAPLVERMLGLFNFSYKEQSNSTLTVKGIAEKDGHRFAVYYGNFGSRRFSSDNSFNKKKSDQLKQDMEILGCDRLIAFAFGEDQSLAGLARSLNGIYMDIDDMKRMAQVFDNRKENEEAGIFQKLVQDIALNRPLEKEESSDELEDEEDDDDSDGASMRFINKKRKS